jgi:SAM-dependent methyltransferase
VNCVVCSSNDWQSLPVPAPGQAVTTSGIIIAEPLEREQCMSCGLLQKKGQRFIGHSQFYEEQYQNYYERPNVERFDRGRYVAMAEWMKSALGDDFAPRSILDVGCGAGWSMEATQRIYRTATIAGVEPSIANAQKARSAGFEVLSTRFGDGTVLSDQYDLIYSNNVLQHVTDLPGYFRDLAANLGVGGRIAMILPDATDPSNEMLWCDHNFSFRPKDFAALAEPIGLHICNWQSNPPDNALLHKQIVVLAKSGHSRIKVDIPERALSAAALLQQRSLYLSKWQELDGELTRRTAGHNRVFNFGASMWTWLLAGYCPNYWSSVSACLVDGGSGRCMGKPVASPVELEFSAGDCIALGVNPASQAGFERKLSGLGVNIVGWADLISG